MPAVTASTASMSPRRSRARRAGLVAIITAAVLVAIACSSDNSASRTPTSSSSVSSSSSLSPSVTSSAAAPGIHKIQHVVVIMQENRSFDSYFGTFPGADGIPMQNGQPTVCVNDPASGQCVQPFHDPNDLNHGGPHGQKAATNDIDASKMDGFIGQAEAGQKVTCTNQFDPACATATSDVMGYHDQLEIPNYWTYAEQFVLQDHMFEPNASWSLPEHLFMVSGWSAKCSTPDPLSCQSALESPDQAGKVGAKAPNYAWTDLTYLLHQANVSWGYYVAPGTEPDCADDAMPARRSRRTPERPTSGTRFRGSRRSRPTARRRTSRTSTISTRPRRTGRCPRCHGSSRTAKSASIRRH